MELIQFSRFYCPFFSALHPHVELAQEGSASWAKEFNINNYDRKFSCYSWMAARAFPFVEQDDLKLVSDWMWWVFLLDDAYDELGDDLKALRALLDELNAVVREEQPIAEGASPLAISLHDLWTRMTQKAPSGWAKRHRQTLIDYFEAAYWEAQNRVNQEKPDFATYLNMRQHTSGCYTIFALIEITERLNLPQAIFELPDFQRLYYLANITACLMNDIFSYNKEKDIRDIHNLIFILQDEQSLSVEDAITRVIDMHNQYIREMIQLEANFPSFGDNIDRQIQQYMKSLHFFLRGHYEWSLYDTGRYLAANQK